MPVKRTIEQSVPAQGTPGTVQDFVIGKAPFGGVVSAVTVVPEAAVTAQATNFRTLRVVNKGQAGAGSTVVASHPLDTAGTDNLVAFDEKAIPLSVTPADLQVAAGDVLVADETVTGTGLAHGGYKVIVEISRG